MGIDSEWDLLGHKLVADTVLGPTLVVAHDPLQTVRAALGGINLVLTTKLFRVTTEARLGAADVQRTLVYLNKLASKAARITFCFLITVVDAYVLGTGFDRNVLEKISRNNEM